MDFKKEIKNGSIFIYPTDTIYGIGCNAYNIQSVKKIKKLKGRDKDKPLSIIAPSKKWIKKYCIIDKKILKYLPGPYTLILKKKNLKFLKEISPTDSLGIRIPNCEFAKLIKKTNTPFITTSVNLSNKPFAKKISDIDKKILDKVNVIIGTGKLNGNPSTLIINGEKMKR